jgi:hypothetical protein
MTASIIIYIPLPNFSIIIYIPLPNFRSTRDMLEELIAVTEMPRSKLLTTSA